MYHHKDIYLSSSSLQSSILVSSISLIIIGLVSCTAVEFHLFPCVSFSVIYMIFSVTNNTSWMVQWLLKCCFESLTELASCSQSCTTASLNAFSSDWFFWCCREIAKHLPLPPIKLRCSMLAEDAIKAAVRDYGLRQWRIKQGALRGQ